MDTVADVHRLEVGPARRPRRPRRLGARPAEVRRPGGARGVPAPHGAAARGHRRRLQPGRPARPGRRVTLPGRPHAARGGRRARRHPDHRDLGPHRRGRRRPARPAGEDRRRSRRRRWRGSRPSWRPRSRPLRRSSDPTSARTRWAGRRSANWPTGSRSRPAWPRVAADAERVYLQRRGRAGPAPARPCGAGRDRAGRPGRGGRGGTAGGRPRRGRVADAVAGRGTAGGDGGPRPPARRAVRGARRRPGHARPTCRCGGWRGWSGGSRCWPSRPGSGGPASTRRPGPTGRRRTCPTSAGSRGRCSCWPAARSWRCPCCWSAGPSRPAGRGDTGPEWTAGCGRRRPPWPATSSAGPWRAARLRAGALGVPRRRFLTWQRATSAVRLGLGAAGGAEPVVGRVGARRPAALLRHLPGLGPAMDGGLSPVQRTPGDRSRRHVPHARVPARGGRGLVRAAGPAHRARRRRCSSARCTCCSTPPIAGTWAGRRTRAASSPWPSACCCPPRCSPSTCSRGAVRICRDHGPDAQPEPPIMTLTS